MSRWASALLTLSMLLWTGLTATAGWFALRPASTDTTEATVVTYDVAAPQMSRRVHYLTVEQAAATLPAPVPEPVRFRNPGIAQPPPEYALSAGIGPGVRPVDADLPRPTPTPSSARKGVVVLDPGHGRGDPGATHYLPDGTYDVTEAASNLRNAELIRDNLVEMGYEVYLTRDGPGRGPDGVLHLQFITSDLYWRVALARAVDADVYLAIHGNGATNATISGPETWYCGRHAAGTENERLAALVQRAMMDALHEYGYFPPDRGIKEDAESHHSGEFCQFVVTRESPVPAALLEFLFLSNDADAAVLVDDESHVIMARHVARAIDEFMQTREAAR